MSWTCPGHYKVHVHGRDSPGRPVHGYCPVPLPALPVPTSTIILWLLFFLEFIDVGAVSAGFFVISIAKL